MTQRLFMLAVGPLLLLLTFCIPPSSTAPALMTTLTPLVDPNSTVAATVRSNPTEASAPVASPQNVETPVATSDDLSDPATTTSPATSAELPEIQIKPLATAGRISFLGWSPDGESIAYLEHRPEDLAAMSPFPPGALKFLNASIGQVCDSNLVFPEGGYNRAGQINWTSDGGLLVRTSDSLMQGKPCGRFSSVTDQPFATVTAPDLSLSPGGGYRARTEVDGSGGILNLTTTILNVQTGQALNRVEWCIDERLGDLGLGGEWLTEELFLIYETLDQGPLLVMAGQGVSPIALELFGLTDIPSMLGPEEFNLSARGSVVTGTQTYHLILAGVGIESNFPPIKLYHSETGQVEELPFKYTGWPVFSPDGRWLVLDARPIRDGYESSELRLRPVDPVGSDARRLTSGDSSVYSVPSHYQNIFYDQCRKAQDPKIKYKMADRWLIVS